MVGTWRSYLRDSSGLQFGFTVYKDDGSIVVTSDTKKEPTVIGSITFAKGIATITTNANSAAATNCVGNGSYQVQMLRLGDQPVALTYHWYGQVTKDICFGRVGGFVQPMLYYPGTGKDLLPLDANSDALSQSLVPCQALPRPCDVVATKPADVKGFWKVYFDPVAQGVGFQRNSENGINGNLLVGDGDDLTKLKEFFPPNAFPNTYNGPFLLSGDPTATDECASSISIQRVIKFGSTPVAIHWTAIRDACVPRNDDFAYALIWVKGL